MEEDTLVEKTNISVEQDNHEKKNMNLSKNSSMMQRINNTNNDNEHREQDHQADHQDHNDVVHDILSNLDSRHLEATLVLSDFLTKFHSYCGLSRGRSKCNIFQKSQGGSTRGVVVSPLDILSVMEYRQDLERYKVASALYYSFCDNPPPSLDKDDKDSNVGDNHDDDIDVNAADSLQNLSRQWMLHERDCLWIRMQNRIFSTKGRMSTDQDVDSLISALEVKLAKEMSSQLLLQSLSSKNKKKKTLSSTTLMVHDSVTDNVDMDDIDKHVVVDDDDDDDDDDMDNDNVKSKSKKKVLFYHLPCSSTLLNMPTENYLSTLLPPKRFACLRDDGTRSDEHDEEEEEEEEEDDEYGSQEEDQDGQSSSSSSSSSSSLASSSSPMSSAVGTTRQSSYKMKQKQMPIQATHAIPVNYLTSRELLRISSMISKLPITDLEALHSSPLTYSVVTGLDYKHYIEQDKGNRQSNARLSVFYTKDKGNAGEDKLLIGVSSTLRGTDLLALWIRAQRDTSASRHLLALFDINPWQGEKKEEEQGQNRQEKTKAAAAEEVIDLNSVDSDNDKDMEIEQQLGNRQSSQSNGIPNEISFPSRGRESKAANYSKSHVHEPYFTATYVGNPSKLRSRIEKESPLLDRLTEWAVMNQVLYTQEFMRERLSKSQHGETERDVCMGSSSQEEGSDGIEKNLKGVASDNCDDMIGKIQIDLGISRKKRLQPNINMVDRNSKRRRVYDDISPPELQIAYQSYILRWFVRRNYDVLKIVFTSKKNPRDDEEINGSEDEAPAFKLMTTRIKNYLRDKYVSTDRTFDRIDRRILIGKFSSFTMFIDAVDHLLEALSFVFATDKSVLIKVETAKKDFHQLCCMLCPDSGENHMVNRDDCNVEETIKILRALPRPWHDDKCHSCNLTANRADRVICQNCETWVHKYCLPQESSLLPSPSLNDDTLKYLKGIYFSSQKLSCTSDFINNPITWEKKNIIIQRERVIGGAFPKWGLTLQNTEACGESYNKYFANFSRPGSWDQAEMLSSSVCDTLLVKLPHKGLLITKSVGPSSSCGLKEGDVIVEMEIVGNGKTPCVLKDIKSSKERLKYFSASTDKIALTIFRPAKDIIAISENFGEALMNVHKKVAEIHHNLTDSRWYCNSCKICNGVSSANKSDEASICQRVLRRLAMEQCFLPFHDEKLPSGEHSYQYHDDDGGAISIESDSSNEARSINASHLKHISLRRLDQIMEVIKEGSFHGKTVLYTPPWCHREGLCWVNRSVLKNPKRLLCTGMFLIVEYAKYLGYGTEKIDELIATFIRTFVPMCMDGIGDFNGFQSLKVFSGRNFLPWLSISCENCFVRPARKNECKCDFCANSVKTSIEMPLVNRQRPELRSQMDPSEKIFDTEKVLSHDVIKYDLYSSFIGTSFIVDMDDPLIIGVCEKTKLIVDEGRRDAELVIISYVPKDLLSRKERDYLVYEQFSEVHDERWGKANGLFFILPILSYWQLDFISKFCHVQVSNKCPSESEMLKLEGMIAMTPTELLARLQRSSHIVTAVNRSVASIVTKFGSAELPMMIFEKGNEYTSQSDALVHDCYDTLGILTYSLRENESSNRLFETCFLASVVDYLVSSTLSNALSLSKMNRYPCRLQDRGYYNDDSKRNRMSNYFRKVTSKQLGSDSSSMLSIMYGMVVVEPFLAQKNGECELCYTDLIHWEPRDKNKMTKSGKKITYSFKQLKNRLSKISLLKPACALNPNNTSEYKEITIVMHRECDRREADSDDEYFPHESNHFLHSKKSSLIKFYGKGWGLELVRWADEKHVLRVGRIAPLSPAEKSGLRPHDVVKCINGKPVRDSYHSNADLASSLLRELCDIEKDRKILKDANILYLHELRNKASVRGPVVLSILRSAKNKKCIVENNIEVGSATTLISPQPQISTKSNVSTQNNVRFHHPITTDQNNHNVIHADANSHDILINQPPTFIKPQIEILHRKHLYRSGVNGTFLTIAETAVLMMAIELNHPKLSLRLLSPRYPSARVNEEYVYRIKPFLEKNGINSIPKLDELMWNKVLEFDHLRIQKEDGPVIFFENNFGYREAKIRFPIDKFLENYFDINQKLYPERPNRLDQPNMQEAALCQLPPHRSHSSGDTTVLVNNHSYPHLAQPIANRMDKTVNLKNHSYRHEVRPIVNPISNTVNGHGVNSSNIHRANQLQPSMASNFNTNATREGGQSELHQNNRACSNDKSHVNQLLPIEDRPSKSNVLINKDVGNPSNSNTNTPNTNVLQALALNDPQSNLGKVVIGYDRTDKHNILLGVVVNISPSRDTFTAKVLHDTASGILSTPKKCQIDAKSFYVLPNITCTESTSNLIRKAIPYIRSLEKQSLNCNDINSISMKSEASFASPSTFIGILPDGRSVHWFLSDPSAVYIQDHEDCKNDSYITKSRDDILSAFQINSEISKARHQPFLDVKCGKSLIFCPWGCCTVHRAIDQSGRGYPLLTFNSISELKEHISKVHSYDSYRRHKTLRRIPEGRPLRDLCADLTIYLCCLSSSLRRFTHHYHKDGGEYPMRGSIIIDPVSWRGLDYKSLAVFEDNAPLASSAIKLWDRLDSLFSIEVDGSFRFHEMHEIRECIPHALSRIHSDEMKLFKVIDTGLKDTALGLETWKKDCFNPKSNFSLFHDCLKPIVKAKGSGIEAGVGCALISSLRFDFDHSETRQKLLQAANDSAHASSDLDIMKALLFNIAANVPRSLYATKMHMFTETPKSEFWADIDIWIRFVRRCISTRMIAQAYVALQSSIIKQKMPKWWRTSKSGWSSSLVIMQNPTISSVSLLVFVLDIGISEFMATATKQSNNCHQSGKTSAPSPPKSFRRGGNTPRFIEELERLNFKERFRLLESLANKIGLPPHEGDYAEECMLCDNGGDLLCCEYCENVIHQECLGSPDKLDDVAFVCSECICDIAKLKESYERERE